MIFRIINPKDDLGISAIHRQFCAFSTGDEKLPCFCISIFKHQSGIFEHDKPIDAIEEYNFYEQREDGFLFSFRGFFMLLSEDCASAKVYFPDGLEGDGRFETVYLLMLAYKYRLISTGNLLMHSAAVVSGKSCVMFCGMSGAGKSTQAGLWRKHLSAWALNYDQPAVICEADAVYAHGTPWSGKEEYLLNSYAPLKAIVFVEQSKKNEAVLLSKGEAFSQIYLNNYVYPISGKVEQKFIDNIKYIAERVPVYILKCDISEDAVKVMYETVFSENYDKVKRNTNMKYKTKDSFIMKEIAGDFLVIPRGSESLSFSAVVVFNETGAFLWNKMNEYVTADRLTKILVEKYSISVETAHNDVTAFINKMSENGLLDIEE